MEEQVDTERTKTERTETKRTDQEREYASYTQYTMHVRSEASMNATFDEISLLDRSMYYWAHAVQTFVEWWMYFDTTQLPSFTPPDASTFLYFTDTNFKC